MSAVTHRLKNWVCFSNFTQITYEGFPFHEFLRIGRGEIRTVARLKRVGEAWAFDRAGVRADDIGQAFGGRRVARVMPTSAEAISGS